MITFLGDSIVPITSIVDTASITPRRLTQSETVAFILRETYSITAPEEGNEVIILST